MRKAEVVWRAADHVLLKSGLEDGDLLITSDIPTPVVGMQLEIYEREQTHSREL